MQIRSMIVACLLALSSLSAFGQDKIIPTPVQPIPIPGPAQNSFDLKYEYDQFALSGKQSRLGNYWFVRPDCSPSDWTDVSIIKPPSHGKAIVVDARTIVAFPRENPRSLCNGKLVVGRALEYTPDLGYKGAEEIVVELITSDGTRAIYTHRITVK